MLLLLPLGYFMLSRLVGSVVFHPSRGIDLRVSGLGIKGEELRIVAIAKRLLWEGVTETPSRMMAKERPLLAWVGEQADAAEGVRSFLERRLPEWKLVATSPLSQLVTASV